MWQRVQTIRAAIYDSVLGPAISPEPESKEIIRAPAEVETMTMPPPSKRLLGIAAGINKQCNMGMTALHYAAQNQNVATIKVLIEHGADVRIRDKSGRTARDCVPPGSKSDDLLCAAETGEVERYGKHGLHRLRMNDSARDLFIAARTRSKTMH
jgi:hypothetical protein